LSTEELNLDLISLLPERHRKTVEALLFANWTAMAAFCYESSLTQGRGLMIMHIRESRITSQSAYIPWGVIQASWLHLMQGTDPQTQERIRSYVSSYDPAAEVALMIDYDDDPSEVNILVVKINHLAIGLFKTQPNSVIPMLGRYKLPSPKEAFEQQNQEKA
jgi:hypothetical protein